VEAGWIDIAWAIDQADAQSALKICAGFDEASRAALSPKATDLASTLAPWWGRVPSSEERRLADNPSVDAQIFALAVVRLCLGPPSLVPPSAGFFHRKDSSVVTQAVVQRPRQWREEWAKQWHQWVGWFAARELVATSQISRPAENYALWMVWAMIGSRFIHNDPDYVYKSLLNHPDLLEDEAFLVFDIAGDVTYRAIDSSSAWDFWAPALLRLLAEGRIERDRLLDGSLSAIESEPLTRTVSTMAVFHGKLRPTIDEVASRANRYLALLESDIQPAIAVGIRQATRLSRAGDVDDRELVEKLPREVHALKATTAKGVISLVDDIVGRNAGLANDAGPIILSALLHGDAAVQAAALAVAENNAALREGIGRTRIEEALPGLDPAARIIGERIIGRSEHPRAEASAAPAEVVPRNTLVPPPGIPRLRHEDAIVPIHSIDELLQVTSRMLEAPDDPDEIERWLDGVSRLCTEEIPDSRQAALQRRTRKLRKDDRHRGSMRQIIATLAESWLDGHDWRMGLVADNGPHAAATRRIRALANRCSSGAAAPLLSAPTHRGGWIDSWALVQRIRASYEVDDDDLAQAVLRVAGDQAQVAAEVLANTLGEAALVVRAIWDETIAIPATTNLPASWDSVRVIRAPEHPRMGALIETHPILPWDVEPHPPASPITLLTAPTVGGTYPPDFDARRWLSLLWPANREPYYEWVLSIRTIEHPWWMTPEQAKTFGPALEPMLHPDEPLGPLATELLGRALGSTPADRILATDVAIEAISTRRLDCQALGETLARLRTEDAAIPNRWAEALLPVAGVGPLHSYEIQTLLESLIGAVGKPDARMTRVVDLLRAVAQNADAKITNPQAVEWLRATKAGSKLGTAAHQLLAISGNGAKRSTEAAHLASEAQLAQEQRWGVQSVG
jgi:hypothetical protein